MNVRHLNDLASHDQAFPMLSASTYDLRCTITVPR